MILKKKEIGTCVLIFGRSSFNKLTIKDKFLILVIVDLLDELHEANFLLN